MITMAMLNATYYTNKLTIVKSLMDHCDTIVIAESEPSTNAAVFICTILNVLNCELKTCMKL